MRTNQERQLYAEGYTFSGIYSSRDKEEVKARAAQFRKEGIPAKVLTKRYEGRSGTGTGWSVFIKKEATPPAKASQDTIDFYWPEIKQARLAKEARAALEKAALARASEIWDLFAFGDINAIRDRLLDMHDRGLIEIKKAAV